MITIFEQLDRDQADAYGLVLIASGIDHRVIDSDGGFRITVAEADVDAAQDAIHRYQSENRTSPAQTLATQSAPKAVNLSGVTIALMLLAVHVAIIRSSAPQDYITAFAASARHIASGEWYRCATALVMHADAAHIAGNMVGMVIFGGAVCAVTGSGVGWLLILLCGIFGNLINAFVNHTGHQSVGASTAVFGAVGILCALQVVNAVRTGQGWKQVILVLGAGMALLAFLGTSARSDVGAHLFGFFMGVLLGGVYRLCVVAVPARVAQALCGTVAAATLFLAWVRGAVS